MDSKIDPLTEPLIGEKLKTIEITPPTESEIRTSLQIQMSTLQNTTLSNKEYRAILALSCGAFAVRLNEFIPLSFLHEIADSYDISIATTALLMFSFMLGSSISLPITVSITTPMDHYHLLIALQGLLAASALICAISPEFSLLLSGRLLSSFAHATYMGTAAVSAAKMVPEHKRERASNLFFAGSALASILGIPLDTIFGQHTEWRTTFWPIAALALCSAFSIILFLKNENPGINEEALALQRKKEIEERQRDLNIFKKPDLWLALSASMFAYAGLLTSYTFFAQMMIDLSGYSKNDLPWLIILYGTGALLGTLFGERLSHVSTTKSVTRVMVAFAIVLFSFNFTVNYKIPAAITLLMTGFTGYAVTTPLMHYTALKAGSAKELAETANNFAFGMGAALGIFLAILAIHHGYGYRSPNWIGGCLVLIGLCCIILGERQVYLQRLEKTINSFRLYHSTSPISSEYHSYGWQKPIQHALISSDEDSTNEETAENTTYYLRFGFSFSDSGSSFWSKTNSNMSRSPSQLELIQECLHQKNTPNSPAGVIV